MNNECISRISLQSTVKTYNINVSYNSDNYFFSVETMQCNYREDANQLIVTEISRGASPFDWGKKLKKSEMKHIKQIIEDFFINQK